MLNKCKFLLLIPVSIHLYVLAENNMKQHGSLSLFSRQGEKAALGANAGMSQSRSHTAYRPIGTVLSQNTSRACRVAKGLPVYV